MKPLIDFHLAEYVDECDGDIERAIRAYFKEVNWWLRTDGHIAGVRLEFDNAKTRCGCFKPSRAVISLSRLYVEHASVDAIENTILHEFAHACDHEERGHSGHDENWRSWCKRLGMTRIERCADADECAGMPQGRYEAYCPKCDEVVAHRWRLTAGMRRGALHNVCRTRVEWRDTKAAA